VAALIVLCEAWLESDREPIRAFGNGISESELKHSGSLIQCRGVGDIQSSVLNSVLFCLHKRDGESYMDWN